MPYAKTSVGYPLEMKTAIERVVEVNLPLRIECETERKARSLRGRFYQYLAACKRDADHPPSIWTAVEQDLHKAYLRRLYTVEFLVEGNVFVIRPRDKSPLAELIAKGELVYDEALAVPQTEQSGKLSKDEAGLLDRLLNLQGEKTK